MKMKVLTRALICVGALFGLLIVGSFVFYFRICACGEYRQLRIVGAPPASNVYINDRLRTVTNEDGSAMLGVLITGGGHQRVIEVKVTHDGCVPFETKIGVEGSKKKPISIIARLEPAK